MARLRAAERLAKREAAKKQQGGGFQGDPKDAAALQAYVQTEMKSAQICMSQSK